MEQIMQLPYLTLYLIYYVVIIIHSVEHTVRMCTRDCQPGSWQGIRFGHLASWFHKQSINISLSFTMSFVWDQTI